MSGELREAQLRQEYRAEIMRGYQAALCNSDIPGWTLGDEVAKVADNLLAAHPVEPAPVATITDEMVEAAARTQVLGTWEQKTDRERGVHLRRSRRALEAALREGPARSEVEVKAEALEEAVASGEFPGLTLARDWLAEQAVAAALRAGDPS